MPEKDGRYFISFDVPEFYTETVDMSFDYPKCRKAYERILGVKVPYPKCSKEREVIKFDVPRIRWKRVEIETPYANEDEFDEKLKEAIDKLIDSKKDFEEGKKEISDTFDEKIEDAKESGATEEAELMELEKQVALKRLELQIAALEKQIEELGGKASEALKGEIAADSKT